MESAPELLGALNLPQRFDRFLRLGSVGVVRIAAGIVDDAVVVDDVARGDRQSPTVVTVALGEIDPELEIDRLEIIRERPPQSVGGGDFEPGVAENLEAEPAFFLQCTVLLGDLRRDRDEGGAGIFDL